MVIDVVKEVVVCLREAATDTQSTAVEHTPEGEGEEVETQGEGLAVAVVIDFAVLVGGIRLAVLDEMSRGFHFVVLFYYQ